MTRTDKVKAVEELANDCKGASAIIVCNYMGLSVKEFERLRVTARGNNLKVRVVKNRLAKIAFSSIGIENLELIGTNVLVWGDDSISASKTVCEFAKENDNFDIRSAHIDGNAVGVDKVEALSKLPSRDELLGMLASVWMAPIRNFTVGLNQLKEKKESE